MQRKHLPGSLRWPDTLAHIDDFVDRKILISMTQAIEGQVESIVTFRSGYGLRLRNVEPPPFDCGHLSPTSLPTTLGPHRLGVTGIDFR